MVLSGGRTPKTVAISILFSKDSLTMSLQTLGLRALHRFTTVFGRPSTKIHKKRVQNNVRSSLAHRSLLQASRSFSSSLVRSNLILNIDYTCFIAFACLQRTKAHKQSILTLQPFLSLFKSVCMLPLVINPISPMPLWKETSVLCVQPIVLSEKVVIPRNRHQSPPLVLLPTLVASTLWKIF